MRCLRCDEECPVTCGGLCLMCAFWPELVDMGQFVWPLEMFRRRPRPQGDWYATDPIYNSPGLNVIHARTDEGKRATVVLVSCYGDVSLCWYVEHGKFFVDYPEKYEGVKILIQSDR